jgi:hypothetical protein
VTSAPRWMVDKAIQCINLGLAEDHSADCYRLYNPETEKVILSRDVRWGAWDKSDPTQDLAIFEGKIPKPGIGEDNETYEGLDDKTVPDASPPGEIPVFSPARTRAASKARRNEGDSTAQKKVSGTLKDAPEIEARMQKEANRSEIEMPKKEKDKPSASDVEMEQTTKEGTEIERYVHFVYNAALMSDPGTPATITEALLGTDKEKWRKALLSELNTEMSLWEKIERGIVAEKERKIIPQKWVLKRKNEQDGSIRYKSRSMTKGYMQVLGVDFIGIGFLTQEEYDKYCIKMFKSQYGNVDAALRWLKTLMKLLTEIGLTQSSVDPCLFYKKDANTGKTVLLVMLHVDNVDSCGTKEEIEWLKKKVREKFSITDLGRMKGFLGLWYEWERDENGPFVKASMNELAETIVGDYEKHVGRSIKEAKTPGFPGTTLQNGEDDQAKGIETEKYRSLVRNIMYYVTNIAPDCANAARELSQYLGKPTQGHWRALERLVGYMKQKTSHYLIYRKPRELRVMSRTKRISVCFHFMRNEVTAGKVIAIFVPSEENESDILTKSVVEKLFQYPAYLWIGTLRHWSREDVRIGDRVTDSVAGTPTITSQSANESKGWKSIARHRTSS